jgi:predicted ATP-grasp superfamily ATP-dependent carboligase
MTVAIEKIAAYFGLRGLNSADFMVDGDTSWLLEVNPRPGATLDIYDTEYNRLFARHCDASEGLATTSVYFDDGGTSAAAVVYADNGDLTTPYISESPDWLKDRPLPGTQIRAGHPLCTVLANKKTISQCRQVCDERGLLAQALYYNQK